MRESTELGQRLPTKHARRGVSVWGLIGVLAAFVVYCAWVLPRYFHVESLLLHFGFLILGITFCRCGCRFPTRFGLRGLLIVFVAIATIPCGIEMTRSAAATLEAERKRMEIARLGFDPEILLGHEGDSEYRPGPKWILPTVSFFERSVGDRESTWSGLALSAISAYGSKEDRDRLRDAESESLCTAADAPGWWCRDELSLAKEGHAREERFTRHAEEARDLVLNSVLPKLRLKYGENAVLPPRF